MPIVIFHMFSFPNVFAGKAFTNTMTIGEDFMTTITFIDFKEKSSSFPWVRAGLLAANLQSPICKDGIGKLLLKTDVEKLKAPAMRANLASCEANLAHGYTIVQKHGLHATRDGRNLFARFLVRSILYLTKKQHKSRDEIQFENLGEISSTFSQELHDLLNGTNTAAPSSSSTAEQEVPESFQECVLCLKYFIKHTVLPSFLSILSLKHDCWQESSDAKLIAKRKWGLEENTFYHRKGDLKHWQFKSITDTVATFVHMPLFPPKDGQPWKMEVELDELKDVKKAATEPPQLLLSQAVQDLLPESLGSFHQEKLKAEATIAMTQLYHE